MHFELDPPNGITGFPFGLPAEDVKRAAAATGQVNVMDEGVSSKWAHMKVEALHAQVELTCMLEDGSTLTAVDIWRPRPGPEEISVTWRGIDVFAAPAAEVLAHVEAQGYEVNRREPFTPIVPGLSLGFSLDTSDEDIPVDDEGGPLYFVTVLVGPKGYYDAVLQEIARMGL